MRRDAGLIAAITVLLAVFGVSSFPRKAAEQGVPAAGVKESKSSLKEGAAAGTPAFAPCAEIKSRIQPFLVSPSADDWAMANSCYAASATRPTAKPQIDPRLNIIIATVPNPVSTHLPLFFDRMIEVIQQAAQDENYSYNSSWFPWDSSSEYLLLADQQRAELERDLLQEQPGIMTFRRAVIPGSNDSPYPSGLVVFVVAEQPTGGVNGNEFESALQWMQALGAFDHKRHLHILGPTFSGSLPSLRIALDSATLPPSSAVIHIFSGTVSGESSYNAFKTFLNTSCLGDFRTFAEGDDLMLSRFKHYISNQGYDLGKLAVLSEDETAFGTREVVSGSNPIFLYYPRDIATLRSAYEKQSIFSSAKPQSSGTPSTSLHSDLSEPENSEHDSVRTYGDQLTPLAQESVLVSITNVLNEHHVQFIILRSTNSLDQIFLTEFLRRAYPQGRVVIDGADLLFGRGGDGVSLRGIMTLSTYPLLTLQQDWTGKDLAYRTFQEDVSAGGYIAARELISEMKPNPAIPITDYSSPAWMQENDPAGKHPATWLSVIGRHQFWPLAVLTEHPENRISEPLPVSVDGNSEPLWIVGELQFLLLAAAVWAVFHFLWCWRGSIAPNTSAFRLAYFAPIARKQHPALISIGSLLIMLVAVIAGATTGFLTLKFSPGRELALAAWGMAILVLPVIACWKNFHLPLTSADGFPGRQTWQRNVALAAILLFAGLFGFHLFLALNVKDENAIPAFWRSSHVFSGVSPLTPQIFLLVGLYLWFWFSLRGLALFGDDRPLLPHETDLPPSGLVLPESVLPMFSQEEAAQPLEDSAIPLGKRHLRMFAIVLPITVVSLRFALEGFAVRTLGERVFGMLIFGSLSLCIAIILTDTVQLWTIWKRLKTLLVYLDRLPLRRTLAALRGLSWASVWSMSGNTLEERYLVISRQFESLRHLENCLEACTANTDSSPDPADRDQVEAQIKSCQKKNHEFVTWYVSATRIPNANIAPLRRFQESIALTAACVLKHLLLPAWQKEKESLIFDRAHDFTGSKKKEEKDPKAALPSAKGVPEYVLAAEEFFVLPYLGFIQNVMGRLRTIVLGSLFLFVATTLAVSSYPFDPLPVLGGIFLGVFAFAAGFIISVFAQMNRDATLSYITDTTPGELGGHFWVQLITFGFGPLLGLLTTLFPAITDFVGSWLQPSLQTLK